VAPRRSFSDVSLSCSWERRTCVTATLTSSSSASSVKNACLVARSVAYCWAMSAAWFMSAFAAASRELAPRWKPVKIGSDAVRLKDD